MKPESRIKLIRSLEEIRIFEQEFNNHSPILKFFNRWFAIFFYLILSVFFFNNDLKQKIPFLAIMAIPTVAYSFWLSAKNKSDERFKLIATAILELGSVAQEVPILEPTIQKKEIKIIKPKKLPIKRKKK